MRDTLAAGSSARRAERRGGGAAGRGAAAKRGRPLARTGYFFAALFCSWPRTAPAGYVALCTLT
jgi:hypothetical protein